jgi:hypothetical protein
MSSSRLLRAQIPVKVPIDAGAHVPNTQLILSIRQNQSQVSPAPPEKNNNELSIGFVDRQAVKLTVAQVKK